MVRLRVWKPRKVSPKIVQEYLYDPRTIEQRLVTEENAKQLGENISTGSPSTYAVLGSYTIFLQPISPFLRETSRKAAL